MNETKLNFIKSLIKTYYEAGGASLPSAYKSAVIDMIDTVINSETEEERKEKAELNRIKEVISHIPKEKQEEIIKDTTVAFERAWEQIKQYSEKNDKMPTTNYPIETNAKENNND